MAKKPTVSDDPAANAAVDPTPVKPPPAKPARKPRVRKAAPVPAADAGPAKAKRLRRTKTAPVAAPAAEPVVAEPAPTPTPRAPRKPRAPRNPSVGASKPAAADLLATPQPVTAQPHPPEPAPEPAPALAPAPEPEPAAPTPIHDHGLDHGLSPVDLPPMEQAEDDAAGLGWMAGILLVSSLLLLLFNSFAIDKWARALPVTPQTGRIVDAAAAWHAAMGRIDLTLPLETGRSAWHWVKDMQWPGGDEASDEAGAESGNDSATAESPPSA